VADDTYYSLLEIGSTATSAEIKTAYRILIKQVHPDLISKLSPYLKGLAEEKAKELTEAYSVLCNSDKRRQYDRLLADYRRQQSPAKVPEAAHTDSGTASKGRSQPGRPAPTRPSVGQWVQKHPFISCATVLLILYFVAIISSLPGASTVQNPPRPIQKSITPTSSQNLVSQSGSSPVPIRDSPPVTRPIVRVNESSRLDDALFIGTVHNKTANKSSSFKLLLQQGDGNVVTGCDYIGPPLYGSGKIQGTLNGVRLVIVVDNIQFVGELADSALNGTYLVYGDGGAKESGDFELERQGPDAKRYSCSNGEMKELLNSDVARMKPPKVEFSAPPAKVSPNYAVVIKAYATLDKRCAHLPGDNYGRCNYGPETIAELKIGDRLKVLAHTTRAEDGQDICKVQTAQGWVGWIDVADIQLESQ
jgi:curved DNA-binding protein CbpA